MLKHHFKMSGVRVVVSVTDEPDPTHSHQLEQAIYAVMRHFVQKGADSLAALKEADLHVQRAIGHPVFPALIDKLNLAGNPASKS
jgi:hypothetical protein